MSRNPPRMERVLSSSADAAGNVWLTVRFTDGLVHDVELRAVPEALKRAYVEQLRAAGRLGSLFSPDLTPAQRSLYDSLKAEGPQGLVDRVAQLGKLEAGWHEVERLAGFAARPDVARLAADRRDEVRKVKDALYVIGIDLYPAYFDERSGALGALPVVALIAALSVVVGVVGVVVNNISVHAIDAWASTRAAEMKTQRELVALVPPEDRADVVDKAIDGLNQPSALGRGVSTATTILILVGVGIVAVKVVPWALEKIQQRRAA